MRKKKGGERPCLGHKEEKDAKKGPNPERGEGKVSWEKKQHIRGKIGTLRLSFEVGIMGLGN